MYSKKAVSVSNPYNLPVWYDSQKKIHYKLPKQLKDLRIGEQMMIQRLSLYVPIQYLRFGQTCCSGHVCTFPQDVQTICNILPRLPEDVTQVRVIKKFQLVLPVRQLQKVFSYKKVLDALQWLKQYNKEYTDIVINSSTLDWMESREGCELPVKGDSFDKNVILDDDNDHHSTEDKGPSVSNKNENINSPDNEVYGMINKNFTNSALCDDAKVNEVLQDALHCGNCINKVSFFFFVIVFINLDYFSLLYVPFQGSKPSIPYPFVHHHLSMNIHMIYVYLHWDSLGFFLEVVVIYVIVIIYL